MMKKSEWAVLLILFVFTASGVFSAEYRANGYIYRQNNDNKGFSLLGEEVLARPLAFGMYATRNCSEFPLATDTFIVAGSSTLILFPGAVIKYDKHGFKPVNGRIQLVGSDLRDKFFIADRKFELYLEKGNIAIEVTPDSGTYIAVRDKSEGIVKTFERKIIELANGMEIHFPLFAAETVRKRISSFWEKPPAAFSSVRLFDMDSQTVSADQSASASEDIDDDATTTELLQIDASEILSEEITATATEDLEAD